MQITPYLKGQCFDPETKRAVLSQLGPRCGQLQPGGIELDVRAQMVV